jgi:hypothetical protein
MVLRCPVLIVKTTHSANALPNIRAKPNIVLSGSFSVLACARGGRPQKQWQNKP